MKKIYTSFKVSEGNKLIKGANLKYRHIEGDNEFNCFMKALIQCSNCQSENLCWGTKQCKLIKLNTFEGEEGCQNFKKTRRAYT